MHLLSFAQGSLKTPLTAAGRYLLRRAHESFAREMAPDGTPWPALSPVTLALRQQRKESKKTRAAKSVVAFLVGEWGGVRELLVTGHLLASLGFNVGDRELALGTNRKFPGGDKSAAAIHQLGGQAGRGDSVTIPARPFLGVTEQDNARIAELFAEEVRHLV
jgi:phage gpG-like protein